MQFGLFRTVRKCESAVLGYCWLDIVVMKTGWSSESRVLVRFRPSNLVERGRSSTKRLVPGQQLHIVRRRAGLKPPPDCAPQWTALRILDWGGPHTQCGMETSCWQGGCIKDHLWESRPSRQSFDALRESKTNPILQTDQTDCETENSLRSDNDREAEPSTQSLTPLERVYGHRHSRLCRIHSTLNNMSRMHLIVLAAQDYI